MYGWIDAQHFFAHIQFAEDAGPARATSEGLAIEGKQARVRGMIGPDPNDTSIYSDLLVHNLINADDFLHYRESTFMAISAAMSFFLNPQQRALVAGFDDRQIAKLILDNAMSAWSYEDFGVQSARRPVLPAARRLRQRRRRRGRGAPAVRRAAAVVLRRHPGGGGSGGGAPGRPPRCPARSGGPRPRSIESTARKKFPELLALGAGTPSDTRRDIRPGEGSRERTRPDQGQAALADATDRAVRDGISPSTRARSATSRPSSGRT